MDDPAKERASDAGPKPPRVPDVDLIRPIGEGGFGQVWLATNRTTCQLRAVKLIPLRHGEAVDRAGREITSIIRLEENLRVQHPNLLVIYHAGKTDHYFFYIMDPADDVSGVRASSDAGYRPATLKSRLEGGPLPPEDCWRYARQLLAGLACLHGAGMVHRDVKPANCLFVGGELKLADFGLLIKADRQISRVGTQKYMPPDGRMDARADVYAAGLVIYEMLTGRPAGRFPRLGDRTLDVAGSPVLAALNRLALRACQPDPQQRFQDAREMLAELEVSDPVVVARRRRRRRRIFGSIGGVVIALVLAAAAWWATRPPRVAVNFITHPFEATIYLDDTLLKQADGTPCRTPCTVHDLPARVHHVVFKHDQWDDLEAGQVDFAQRQQVVGYWSAGP